MLPHRAEYLESLAGKSHGTRVRYMAGLDACERLMGEIRIDDESLLERFYIKALAHGLAHTTADGHAASMTSYLRFCSRRGLLSPLYSMDRARGSLEAVKTRRERRIPRPSNSPNELLTTILNYSMMHKTFRQRRIVLRDRALLLMLMLTGIRRAEVCRLRRSDNADEFILSGKGGHERVVFLPPDVRALLDKYFERRVDTSDRMFVRHDPGAEGEPLGPSGVSGVVKRWACESGVQAHPHQFRHAYAHRALNRGVSLSALQDLMGHASPDTTKRVYAHYDLEHLRAAARQAVM